MSKDNSYVADVKGKQVTFRHIGAFSMPDFRAVTSVSVIPFTESGNIVAVRLRHRGIDLPGGHVEPGEQTPQETMDREVMEEACMTVRDAVLTEVIESDFFEHASYMLLYGAYVDALSEFIPSDEASERIELSREDFIRQYEAGSKRLMAFAIENAWRQLSHS
jgi:8-oxo-dGTP diphosphatase